MRLRNESRRSLRQFNGRCFRVAAKQRSDMPKLLNYFGVRRRANLGNQGCTRFAALCIDPDFNQFMIIERQQDLVHYRRREAVVADDDDGFVMMGQSFKITLLRVGEGLHKENRM